MLLKFFNSLVLSWILYIAETSYYIHLLGLSSPSHTLCCQKLELNTSTVFPGGCGIVSFSLSFKRSIRRIHAKITSSWRPKQYKQNKLLAKRVYLHLLAFLVSLYFRTSLWFSKCTWMICRKLWNNFLNGFCKSKQSSRVFYWTNGCWAKLPVRHGMYSPVEGRNVRFKALL